MAKTLKQILDGVKSSTKKNKDILGKKPGVDYSPKAGDERKFADKHEIEKHADRAGNGDDVYNATNVKSYMGTEKSGHHGYKAGEDEKVYESLEEMSDIPMPANVSDHRRHSNRHAEDARNHAHAAAVALKNKDKKSHDKHMAAADAHHAADLAHHVAELGHNYGMPAKHDDSIRAHKLSKDAHKLSDEAFMQGKPVREEVELDEEKKCNNTPAGKMCSVHGMKKCTPGQKTSNEEFVSEGKNVTIDSPGHKLHGKTARVFHKHSDGRVNVQVKHSSKKGDVSNLTLKPGQFKESMDESVVSELLVQNYVSGAKGKSAEVHKDLNAGTYSVKKMVGSKLVSSSNHDSSADAHSTAKKHISEGKWDYPKDMTSKSKENSDMGTTDASRKKEDRKEWRKKLKSKAHKDLMSGKTKNEEVELDEKAAVAKSKQTVLVTDKGNKTGGGVKRIKKSDYDPKKHSLAEDDVKMRLKKKLSEFRENYLARVAEVDEAAKKKKSIEKSEIAVTHPNFSVDVNTGRNV